MFRVLLTFVALVGLSVPVYAGIFDELGAAIDGATKDLSDAIDGDAKEIPQSLDIEEADLWSEARFQWGQIYDPKTVKYIKADVTCDGHADYVAHRLNQDNPDGPFYNILVVTREGGTLASEGVSLSFDDMQQEALCGSENVTVSVEHWDEGKIDAVMGGWQGICTEAIKVDDGMCDAPRYFWRTGLSPEDDHPRLMFFRN